MDWLVLALDQQLEQGQMLGLEQVQEPQLVREVVQELGQELVQEQVQELVQELV